MKVAGIVLLLKVSSTVLLVYISFGKVNALPSFVILVTVLKDLQNVSARKMVPGQEFNLRVF